MGSVGPTPLLALNSMEFLNGKTISDGLFEEASKKAREDSKPIADHRGSREYRLDMVEVITNRVLKKAYERAKKRS